MNELREKIELTPEEARNAVYGDLEGYEVVEDKVIDTTRWSIINYCVLKRKSDGKFFADSYSVGATESQYERAFEYSKPDFREVFAVTKTITVYE